MGVFRFKYFDVDDSHCAMKTGTDAVLLGSWVPLPENGTVLDIGCGSGIIAMMMAQRNPSLHITGIEIDPEAANQAMLNIQNLPFSHSLNVVCEDVRNYAETCTNRYDLIVSNPPYFSHSLRSSQPGRNAARHDTTLNHLQLTETAASLLKPNGALSLILPFDLFENFRLTTASVGLYLQYKVNVKHQPDKDPVRALALFGHLRVPEPSSKTIVLHTSEGMHHPDYLELTRDFYLFA